MPSDVGATSAWISTSSGRVPFHAGEDRRPRRRRIAPFEKQRRGVGHLGEPLARHLEHADLVGGAEAVLHRTQDAEMMRAVTLEGGHGIDHVLDHARPGDLPVLGDMAHENHRRAAGLGVADQMLGARTHLRDRARRRFHRIGPHGLDRIDHDQCRHRTLRERRDDVLDIGLGGEFHRALGQPHPLGAQPHLPHRLLARNIGDAAPRIGERRRSLHQERGFADSRITADQDHRAAHEAAAGDAVEFGNAGRRTRRLPALALKSLKGEDAPLGARAAQSGGKAGGSVTADLLDNGIPGPAGLAFTHPAVIDRAAFLAEISRASLGQCVVPFAQALR